METASLFYRSSTVLGCFNLNGVLGAYYSESYNLDKVIHVVDISADDHRVSPHTYQTERPQQAWQAAHCTALWQCVSSRIKTHVMLHAQPSQVVLMSGSLLMMKSVYFADQIVIPFSLAISQMCAFV